MKKTVLIIDDNDKVLRTLEDRIESMGFDFDSADCQVAATALLQKRRYDLILLDQELPIKKGKPTHKQVGRNLLVHIRQDANNESTPVIVVSEQRHQWSRGRVQTELWTEDQEMVVAYQGEFEMGS
jgi:CheY-like chemotaxis protein